MEHWQQNVADDGYSLAKTEPMTGTTGEETAAKTEETAGFTAKEFAQAKIAADGSTVVKIWYDRKTITLTFDADNGGDKTTLSGKFGAEIVPPVPEKTDFIFTGWSTDKIPNESSKFYNDKEKITLTEDLTLYAQWEEISYKINYELNGGTNASENPATFKKSDNVTLKEPTYEYFDFCGWYLTQDFTGENITGWNVGEKTYDVTLYAKWTVKAENVVNAINNLTEGTYNICVVGEIDEDTVKNMGKALRSNENAKVNLDLTGTTGLENIPQSAFNKCSNLTDIKIPESVTSINDFAFGECTGLKNIELSANITNINNTSFSGCRNVTSFYIENGNKYYQSFNNCLYSKDDKVLIYVFGNPSTISFIQNITSIGNGAFYRCTNLTNIEIPKTVTSIGYYAFEECRSLTNIELPESLTSIDSSTFSGCTSLKNIELPESVTTIDSGAFSGCTSLKNIELPESITSIGDYAFSNCTSLTNIKIPESITSIDNRTFSGCTSLTNIKLPEGLTYIGFNVFSGCTSLKNIKIPKNVKTIDFSAFTDCTSLTNIEIPSSVKDVGFTVFGRCSSLTNAKILEGLTYITDYVFYECTSLTNIEIPESVTKIGRYVFYGCSSLTTVNYMGTIEQWKKIDISELENDSLLTAKIICTDGIINE